MKLSLIFCEYNKLFNPAAMGLTKFIQLDYEEEVLIRDAGFIFITLLLEGLRIYLGRKGSLKENGEFYGSRYLLI